MPVFNKVAFDQFSTEGGEFSGAGFYGNSCLRYNGFVAINCALGIDDHPS